MIKQALDFVRTDSSLSNSLPSTSQEHLASEVRQMSRQLHFLAITSEALIEVLQEKLGVQEPELDQAVKAVAERRRNRPPRTAGIECPGCGRAVAPAKPICIYCGATVDGGDPFREFRSDEPPTPGTGTPNGDVVS